MKNESYRNFMGYLWVQKEDNIYTIGVNEDALEDFSTVESVDLPAENEEVEADVVCGTIETDEGPLDLYSPVSGKVVELNAAVLEDSSIITEDPYDAWLLKIESEEDMDEAVDDEDEDDDDDEDEEEDRDWKDEE
jgi:glycine cleavage system H protein